MGRHRDRVKIIADILLVVKGGSRKTSIMVRARLSYTLLCRYLTEVVTADLVCLENGGYLLTEKGRRFLDKFNMYSQYCEHLNDNMKIVNKKRTELEEMCSS